MSFISLTQSSCHVKRWNGVRILSHRRSLAEHHAEVAALMLDFITHAEEHKYYLNDAAKFELMKYAISHDLPEVVTGDVRHVVKRDNPELVEALDKLETRVFDELGVRPTKFTKLIVKVCDLLAVEHEISEELELVATNPTGESKDGLFDLNNVRAIIANTYNKYNLFEENNERLLEVITSFINKFKKTDEEITNVKS